MSGRSSLRMFALLVAGMVSLPLAITTTSADEYLLGPQDKLKIKVYDWRPGTDDTHEWTAVTGEFKVGASGNLSLPIVGELSVARSTTAQVAQKLANELQAKLGLAQPPFASVEVAECRPIYVVGFVDKPGEYAYRPGLTVMQAVGIAGGLRRTVDMNMLGFERDALVNRGEMRAIVAERVQLLVRQARLKAEIDDNDTITLPLEVATRKGEADVARLIDEETQLLSTFRKSISSQTTILQQTRLLLEQEVKALTAKEATLSRQYDLTKKELDTITGLVNKGLAVAPRQVALEQNLAQFESSRLDMQLTQLRAQQDIARADRESAEVRNKARSQALNEANDVRVRLATLAERIKAAAALVYQSEVRAPEEITAIAEQERGTPTYVLVRNDDQGAGRPVREQDLIEPGDTIRVERPRSTERVLNAKGTE